MSDLEEFVRRIVAGLESNVIPYMVVGSLASSAHGKPRMTYDLDVVIAPTQAELINLVNDYGTSLYADLNSAQEAMRRESMFNVIDIPKGLKADLIFLKRRPFDQMEFSRRRQMRVAGNMAWTVSPEDAILSKLEWAKLGESERQYEDAVGVAAIQRLTIDVSYLRNWSVQLGVEPLLERLLDEVGLSKDLPPNHASD